MNKVFIAMVGGVSSLIATEAAAAPAAWCNGAQVEAADLRGLSSKDARDVIRALVAAECAPSEQALAHRGEIAAARQAWSKRLGMTEADWADAVPYAQAGTDAVIQCALAAKTLRAASPLDPYVVIEKAHESASEIDTLYAADMFEPHLSEAGRLAFLRTTCFHDGQPAPVDAYGMTGTEAIWAAAPPDRPRRPGQGAPAGQVPVGLRPGTGVRGRPRPRARPARRDPALAQPQAGHRRAGAIASPCRGATVRRHRQLGATVAA